MSEPDLRAIELAGGFDAPIAILPTAAAPDNNHKRAGVPLRYGAGVKGKVIEAMAEGVPVVTTEIGAEGILGLGDYDCLSIVKSEQMADTLFDVYSNSEIWNKLSLNSRKVVEKYYTEDFLTKTLQEIVFSKEHA